MSLRSALQAARSSHVVPLIVGLVAAIVFRIPPMLNAGGVNSDAAVVGLQALHILEGEWSASLWGTSYQGTLDAILAAASFKLFGPTPFALLLVPLVGMELLIVLWFDLLRRFVSPWAALACVMPLVVATIAINSPMIYLMRQTLMTMVALGCWMFWKAAGQRRPWLLLFVGGFLLGLSLWVDFFGAALMPAAWVMALGAAHEGAVQTQAHTAAPSFVEDLQPRSLLATLRAEGGRGFFTTLRAAGASGFLTTLRAAGARLFVAMLGFAAGLALTTWLRGGLGGGGAASTTFDRFKYNLTLLLETCLPFSVGTKVFIRGEPLHAQLWTPSPGIFALQRAGAVALGLAVLVALVAVFVRRTPRAVRWLVLAGLAALTSGLGGFLISIMPTDMWSARYLAPVFWFMPMTLAAMACWWGPRAMWIVLSPYFATAAICGWLTYGVFVDGPRPTLHPRGAAQDERALFDALKAENVTVAAAQYWLAYRLSFLSQERLIVMPLDESADRYPPYRQAFAGSQRQALIFHPSEPRAQPSQYVQMLRSMNAKFETRQIAGFTVLLLHNRQ
jgi:Dolichyl-phosphate-mannose-protein mannosyltransferase